MRNDLLTNALKVSLEEIEEQQASADLLETLVEEANDLDPNTYVAERIEVEGDVGTLVQEAAGIEEAGVEVTHESLDAAVRLANAVTGRYGFRMKDTGLESFGDASARAPHVVAQLRGQAASLEAAVDVSLESYSVKDLWDHLGILNREIPNMADKIAVLKNYKGSAKISMGSLWKIFQVNNTIAPNLTGAASETAGLVDIMLRLGEEATSNAQKAAEAAYKVDWSDEVAAEKGLKAIAALKNTGKEAYDKLDEKWTLCNRRLNVKRFDLKGGEHLSKDWTNGYSLNVSWPKATGMEIVANLTGNFGALVYLIVQGSTKREVKIEDMVAALEKIKAVATKTASIRSNAPRKWAAHNALVKKLRADVRGSDKAKVAIRAISELDRLGWECLNGAFTVLYAIVRQLNDAADSVTKAAKNR